MRVGRLSLRADSFGRLRVVHAVCVRKPDNYIMLWYNGPLRIFLLINRSPITGDRDHRRLMSIAMASYRGRGNRESEGFWEWRITWMPGYVVLSQILGTANSEGVGDSHDPCPAVKKILATTNHIRLRYGQAQPH